MDSTQIRPGNVTGMGRGEQTRRWSDLYGLAESFGLIGYCAQDLGQWRSGWDSNSRARSTGSSILMLHSRLNSLNYRVSCIDLFGKVLWNLVELMWNPCGIVGALRLGPYPTLLQVTALKRNSVKT